MKVVVFVERVNLRFICKAPKGRRKRYAIGILYEGWSVRLFFVRRIEKALTIQKRKPFHGAVS